MQRFLSALFYLLGLLLLGFAAGGVLGGRVLTDSAMGYDRLAGALGGVMVGLLVAALIAVWSLPRVSVRGRVLGGAGLLATAAVTVWIAAMTNG